jgi:hypothetical protein
LHAEPVVDFEDEENRDDEEDGGWEKLEKLYYYKLKANKKNF